MAVDLGAYVNESVLHVEILSGRDPLRREQLTRALHTALSGDHRLRDVRIEPLSAGPPSEGAKGSIEAAVALLIAGAPYARPTADALIGAIQSWCDRDRRTTVRITDGDRSVDVVGDPTPEQRALVEQFFSGSDGPA